MRRKNVILDAVISEPNEHGEVREVLIIDGNEENSSDVGIHILFEDDEERDERTLRVAIDNAFNKDFPAVFIHVNKSEV